MYGQLSEASRCEVQDHEDWRTSFESKDLLYLLTRIRATHVARQSGNPTQDKERVRNHWANIKMSTNESSFAFKKCVENYQLERLAVGLEELPAEELIIGILNRLDMNRYTSRHREHFNEEVEAEDAAVPQPSEDRQPQEHHGTHPEQPQLSQ